VTAQQTPETRETPTPARLAAGLGTRTTFPDGRTLDKKAYPWLLNVLVRTHLPRLSQVRTHLMRWQAQFSILLAWGLVPLTIAMVWARYLRAHDWAITRLHIALLGLPPAAPVSVCLFFADRGVALVEFVQWDAFIERRTVSLAVELTDRAWNKVPLDSERAVCTWEWAVPLDRG